ncbi:MAG: 50S ribosomal protein L24 [Puniceicoccales bacterium]|jgi:large subunit ribosomal protein L24|nr:50S ribosomal protein L24 [Puniceicoccales bacterium]
MKYRIKRDDEVVVISGAHRGKRGKVLSVLRERCRVVVEGVAMHKRHIKKSREYPEGAIIEKEGSVHYSNVMLLSHFEARTAARGQRSELSPGEEGL